jgi:hypothetical protein
MAGMDSKEVEARTASSIVLPALVMAETGETVVPVDPADVGVTAVRAALSSYRLVPRRLVTGSIRRIYS